MDTRNRILNISKIPFFAYGAWHMRVSNREKQPFKIDEPMAARCPERSLDITNQTPTPDPLLPFLAGFQFLVANNNTYH